MMPMNLSNMAILNIECSDYRSIISGIGKNEVKNIMQNPSLTEKKWNIIKYKKINFIYKNGYRNFNVWRNYN